MRAKCFVERPTLLAEVKDRLVSECTNWMRRFWPCKMICLSWISCEQGFTTFDICWVFNLLKFLPWQLLWSSGSSSTLLGRRKVIWNRFLISAHLKGLWSLNFWSSVTAAPPTRLCTCVSGTASLSTQPCGRLVVDVPLKCPATKAFFVCTKTLFLWPYESWNFLFSISLHGSKFGPDTRKDGKKWRKECLPTNWRPRTL